MERIYLSYIRFLITETMYDNRQQLMPTNTERCQQPSASDLSDVSTPHQHSYHLSPF